ncbi:MAG: hypothetical protein ACOY3K_02265 [Candidatus Omnitrophota bacterium]
MLTKPLNGLLYLALLITSILLYRPVTERPIPQILHSLAEGGYEGYKLPGSDLAALKKWLPPSGALSFLLDRPYKEDVEDSKRYQDAQNYLAPLILNPRPEEPIGILYCSSNTAAAKRLRSLNYKMVFPIGPGKGILLRKK